MAHETAPPFLPPSTELKAMKLYRFFPSNSKSAVLIQDRAAGEFPRRLNADELQCFITTKALSTPTGPVPKGTIALLDVITGATLEGMGQVVRMEDSVPLPSRS